MLTWAWKVIRAVFRDQIYDLVEQETVACYCIAERHAHHYRERGETEKAEAATYIMNSIHARSGTL